MKKAKNTKIAIVTTVSNWSLYKQTSKTFPDNIELFAIDGTKGFYGLRSLLFAIKNIKKLGFRWLIMVDDDVVFKNSEKVFDMIVYMELKNYTVCGMRDGGTLKWRNKNPILINPFFCILDLLEITPTPSIGRVKQHQYINKDEFRLNDYAIHYNNYNKYSLFEHYYCFFLWLKRKNKNFLYLDALTPFDNETTLLLTHERDELLYHSWYSRLYNKEEYHTKRINKIIKLSDTSKPCRQFTILKNPNFDIQHFFYKNVKAVFRKFN